MYNSENMNIDERAPKTGNGIAMMCLTILVLLAALVFLVLGINMAATRDYVYAPAVALIIISSVYLCVGWIPFMGLKLIRPNEALVMTLFGHYYGTLKRAGFYYVNPFASGFNPTSNTPTANTAAVDAPNSVALGNLSISGVQGQISLGNKKISMRVSTLSNEKQKINDQLGNPIIIGIVVIWKVVNPTKAVFNIDNYKEYLSIQCDSALRNIVRLYPYDTFGDDNEKTLRGSSQEIAGKLKDEIQSKAEIGGIEVLEARITQLSYAPEIAAAMLQRQQASAIIDARQMIVEGAVGMVEHALAKLSEKDLVNLDDERKAAMVSNLMVVLCGNRDVQPVVNSGTLY